MSRPLWIRRLDFQIRWGSYLAIVIPAALLAVMLPDDGAKFALGYLAGMTVARYALIWTEP